MDNANCIDETIMKFHQALKYRSILELKSLLCNEVNLFDGANSFQFRNNTDCLAKNPSIKNCLNFKRTLLKKDISIFKDVAIASCQFVCTSEYINRYIEFELLETLVLKKDKMGRWRVLNIHWSS